MARFGRIVVTLVAVLAAATARPAGADVTVNTTTDNDVDDADCSLREAITAANTNADYNGCTRTATAVDTISFALGTGTPSIAVTNTNLPSLSGPTILDGATGGATRVEISGGGVRDTGLNFFGAADATGSAIRNLVINGFTSRQLILSNGSGIVVEGNFIGLDPTGTFRKDGSANGIEICAGFGCGTSQGHRIGGPTPPQRNVIAAAGAAINVGGNGVTIQGNFLNTNAAGTANLAGTFSTGVVTNNVFNTKIGGDQSGEGNLIVGFNGVSVTGNPALSRSTNTVIQGNFIGTDVTGTVKLQTAGGAGVNVAHAVDTLIGGTTAGAGNLLSGATDGISGGSSGVSGSSVDDTTVQGNLIGTDAAGTGPLGNIVNGISLGDDAVIENNLIAFNGGVGIVTNCGACVQTFSQNAIHSNGALGIDLGSDGATDNDAADGDPDAGPNGRQNFPVLDDPVFPGGTTATGTLNSTPGRTFRIEVFTNTACDPSLHGEGETFVGAVDTGVTDGNGDVAFVVTFAQALPATLLTATATDLTTGATSELSDCPVAPPTPTPTVTTTPTLTPTPTATPSPTPVVGAALGHFLGHQAKVAKAGPKFFKLGPVTLEDPLLGVTAGFDVLKPTLLAVPANKNAEGFTDPATHLGAYAVKRAKGSPKFQPRADLVVSNQCGTVVLTAKKPVSLLVPTGLNVATPAPHGVDHFLCYQTKSQKKFANGVAVPVFPKGVQAEVAVGASPARRYDLKKVVALCLPVAKSGTPQLLAGPDKGAAFTLAPATVGDPDSFLVCYQAKLATKTIAQNGCGPATPGDKGTKITPKQPAAAPQLGVHVGNQLGGGALDLKKPSVLCIPSASDT